MRTKFLKPNVDDGGVALDVFIPTKGRNILPDGENVLVDSYIEGRIKCGSLVECDAVKPETKKTKGDSK